MKSFLATAAAMLVSVNVFAAIGVGSSVDYKSVYSDGTNTINQVLNYTILSEDTAKGTFNVQITADNGSGAQVTQQDTETINATFGAGLVASCVNSGGVLEKITVAAGDFETCHITDVDVTQDYIGNFWVADVAFGVAKSVETRGQESYTVELQAVK